MSIIESIDTLVSGVFAYLRFTSENNNKIQIFDSECPSASDSA